MEKSESIAELSAALSKAQGELKGAEKNSVNPFFKQSYANLESVWDACRAQLAKHNIAITQIPENEGNSVIVETVMSHSSGQWISGKLRMVPEKQTPQAIGVCISYARRYALAAFVGIYQEDDDAEATKTTAKSPNTAAKASEVVGQGVTKPKAYGTVSEAQIRLLWTLASKNNWSRENVNEFILSAYGVESASDLDRVKFQSFIELIQKNSFKDAISQFQLNRPSEDISFEQFQ